MISRALLAIGLLSLGACGGDDDDRECVPGDASRPGLACSSGGHWVASTNTTASTQAGSCHLTPGDYMIEYTVVSDTCGIGVLPTELVTIQPGQVGLPTETDPAQVPEGCDDGPHQISGCTATWNRTCLFPTAAGELHMAATFGVDVQGGSATVSLRGTLYDSADRLIDSCASAQAGDISRL